jgi:hypothetical protein
MLSVKWVCAVRLPAALVKTINDGHVGRKSGRPDQSDGRDKEICQLPHDRPQI